jgi:hypothetical protein
MERAGAFVADLAAGGAHEADAAAGAVVRSHVDEVAEVAHAAPAADAHAGAAAIDPFLPNPVPPLAPPEVRIHELDYAGRPSLGATEAMQELVNRRVLGEITTQSQATDRFLALSQKGVDNLTPDDMREIHALFDELPEGIRVPQLDSVEPASIAHAASQSTIYPTGNAWFLGERPLRIVANRAFHQLPDEATALERLRTLVNTAEPTRDNIHEIRAIIQSLPDARVPQLVKDFPERAEAFRQLGWVAKPHGGVPEGFSTHQDAAQILFRLRNHLGGAGTEQLLAQLDGLLDTPLQQWRPSDVRELSNLLQHPQMPRPDVRLGWDLPEVLKQLQWAASPRHAMFDAAGNGTLNLIYTDLKVLRQERLGVMANRTHELAGRIVEGTATSAELQELRMIASREPSLSAALPEWIRSPERDYRSVDELLAIPRYQDELRTALLPSIDATGPTEELRALASQGTLTDDEAIRLVRIAGRLDAFNLPLPKVASDRLPTAMQQALLVSGADPIIGKISAQLSMRHDVPLGPELRTIAEARRVVAMLQAPGTTTPFRSNVDQNVREAVETVDALLAKGDEIDPRIRTLLASSREILTSHQARLGGARTPNMSGVQGYMSHPDYAEIGRAASNIELGAELLTATHRAQRAAGSAAAEAGTAAAESLAW